MSRPHLKDEGGKGPHSLPKVTSVSRTSLLTACWPNTESLHHQASQATCQRGALSLRLSKGAQEWKVEAVGTKKETMGGFGRIRIWL